MGTSDVLKVLKIARAVGECNLRTFKTSLVPINHEIHSRSYDFLYLLHPINKTEKEKYQGEKKVGGVLYYTAQ